MKKLFSSLLAVTFALSGMAAETAYVRMKLAGSNPTYSTSTIKLTENSDRTPAYESGYDSECMMEQSNDNSVLFYAYVGTQECANIATNNLDGLVLCFNTNNIDQNYTISFELVSGRDLTLYDRVTKTSTPIVQGESYPFSVTAAQVGRVAIADRFVINYEAPAYVIMNGDFADPGNAWTYTSNFTDNGTSYSLDLDLAADTWYHFQLEEGYATSYIAADGSEFTRTNNSHNLPVDGWHSALLLYADVAGTYTFTWYDLTDNLTITFPAAPVTGYTVTPNAAGYATFSADEATVIPDGATAYTGTISGEELVLNQITGGYVPANTGVIVAGVAGTPYNFAIYAGSVDAVGGNALKATATYNTSMKNVYVLKGNAFLEYVGTNALAANKAYIQLPEAGQNNAPARISMRFNGTQDVENVETETIKAEKFVENGQVLIRRGNEVYNLQGQIVK